MKKIEDNIKLFNKEIRNRTGMAPMDTLRSKDGFANDFHIQHYGSRANGGIGLIIVEAAAVSPDGRIRKEDLGIWSDNHIDGLKRIVNIAHEANTVIGIQLAHAGSKSELTNEKIGATLHYKHLDQSKLRLINDDDFKNIEEYFISAAIRAKKSGFDFIEIHAAHGYLFSEILHPKLNDINPSKNILIRAEFIIKIIEKIHNEVKIPIGIRVSFDDRNINGISVNEYEPFIKKINKYIEYINISSGSTLHRTKKENTSDKEKIYRLPIVKEVKKFTDKKIFMAGNIVEKEDAIFAIENEVDIVLLGREILLKPNKVIAEFLDIDNLNEEQYKWGDNPWFQPIGYLRYKKENK